MNKVYTYKTLDSHETGLNSLFVRRNSILALAIIFIFSIIAGLRLFGEDRDFFSYQLFYESIDKVGAGRKELFFALITNLIKQIFGSGSFYTFLLIIAFLSLSFKIWLLSKRNSFVLLSVIYFLLILPLHEMTQIRVGLATAFIYWGLYKSTHFNTSILKKTTYLVLGIGSHASTIILAPFVLVPSFFQSRSIIYALLAITVPAVVISNSINLMIYLNPLVEYYVEMADQMETANPFSSRNITFLLILTIGLWNIKKLPYESLPWFYISLGGIGVWYGLMAIPAIAHRLLEITMFSYLFWIIDLPKFSKILALSLLFSFALYSFVRALFLHPLFI